MKSSAILLSFLTIFVLADCKKKATEEVTSPEEELKTDGRKLYIANCIACHSGDPKQDGTVGPSLAGSSFELLKAKLIEGKYPAGYAGKRPISGTMPKYPFSDDQIKSLEAFLK
ncbi:MAG: cytochrome c [Leptospirales bacterium]|nr:cytochrome c [Leptospirales bacterium]